MTSFILSILYPTLFCNITHFLLHRGSKVKHKSPYNNLHPGNGLHYQLILDG